MSKNTSFLCSVFACVFGLAVAGFSTNASAATIGEKVARCMNDEAFRKSKFTCDPVLVPGQSWGSCSYQALRSPNLVKAEAEKFLFHDSLCPRNNDEHCTSEDGGTKVSWWFKDETMRNAFGCVLYAVDYKTERVKVVLRISQVTRGAYDGITSQVSKGGIISNMPAAENPEGKAHSLLDFDVSTKTLGFLLGNLGSSFLQFALSSEVVRENEESDRAFSQSVQPGEGFNFSVQSSVYLPTGYSTSPIDSVGIKFTGDIYQPTNMNNARINPDQLMVVNLSGRWTDLSGNVLAMPGPNGPSPLIQVGPQIQCSNKQLQMTVGVPRVLCTGVLTTKTVGRKKYLIFFNQRNERVTTSYYVTTLTLEREGAPTSVGGFTDDDLEELKSSPIWNRTVSLEQQLREGLINQIHQVPTMSGSGKQGMGLNQDYFLTIGMNPLMLSESMLSRRVEIVLSDDFRESRKPMPRITRSIEQLATSGLMSTLRITRPLETQSDNIIRYSIRALDDPREGGEIRLIFNPGAHDFSVQVTSLPTEDGQKK